VFKINIIITALLLMSAVLFGLELYHRHTAINIILVKHTALAEKIERLEQHLIRLEEETLAFKECGEATEYIARYDFGLKKKQETYVHLP
jgi:uncharacterized protein YxeA